MSSKMNDLLTRELEKLLAQLPEVFFHMESHPFQNCIWEKPPILNTISDQYHFYLRRYTQRVLDDFALYAIPEYCT